MKKLSFSGWLSNSMLSRSCFWSCFPFCFRLSISFLMMVSFLTPPTFAIGDQPFQRTEDPPRLGNPSYPAFLKVNRRKLQESGFTPWSWMNSSCQNCDLAILPNQLILENKTVYSFIAALEKEKMKLLQIYKSDEQEYNLLAQMAIGILGRESRFFSSYRYFAKEHLQPFVKIGKILRVYVARSFKEVSLNSRGPTQIKIIPDAIAENYKITTADLGQPQAAAVATMGYLIEALHELKVRARSGQWSFIKPENYVDYLPYIYFGGKRSLFNGTATPATNIYVQDMKRYMNFVEIYERPTQ